MPRDRPIEYLSSCGTEVYIRKRHKELLRIHDFNICLHGFMKTVTLFLFVCVLFFALAPPVQAGENRAILIGISQYEDPDMNCLAYADEDVREFASILTNFAGYGHSDLVVLLNQSATKKRIADAVERAVKASQKKPLDHFILMFAGHGLPPNIQSNRTNSFLAPHDAKVSAFYAEEEGRIHNDTFINKGWLTRQLTAIKAKTIVLILDSCYSGARNFGELVARNLGLSITLQKSEDSKRGVMVIRKKTEREILENRIAFIASSNENQPSAEYHELKHGALSYCLFQYINAVRKETEDSRRHDITIGNMYDNIAALFDRIQVKGAVLSDFHQPVLFPLPDYDRVRNMTFVSVQGSKRPRIRTGTLEIATDPEGAEVSVDGARTGKNSNCTLELTEGKHIVSLYVPRTNYNHSFLVTVRDGQLQRKAISLRGSLEVESYAEKIWKAAPTLDVYLNDGYVGKTGLRLRDLVAGTHTLEVRVENVIKKRQIEIRPNSPLLVKYKIIREAAAPSKDDKGVGNVVF